MRKIFILLCLFGLSVNLAYAQQTGKGIHFLEGEAWENVLQMAQEHDKYIFMDCYTSWCGPCKALAKDIFFFFFVGNFFNAHFINVKYDMEKGVGKELYERYKANIIGFPTLLLIDKQGKVVHQMAGYQEADALIAGAKAGMEGKSLFAMRDRYKAGERDLAFLKDFVAVLDGAFLTDEIESVVMDYMKDLPLEKLQEKEVWDLVGTFIKDPFSPQFEYVVFNLDRLAYKLGFDRYKVERQLNWALEKEVDRVIELQKDEQGNILALSEETGKIDTLLRLINRANLERAEEYRAKIRIHELELAEDWEEVLNYLSVCRDIRALGYSAGFIDDVIQYMAVKCTKRSLLKECLSIIEALQAEEDNSDSAFKMNYYETFALLYKGLGNKQEAEKYRKMDEQYKQEKAKEFEDLLKKVE